MVVESVLRFEKSSVPSVSASSLAFLSKLQDTGLGFISGSLDICKLFSFFYPLGIINNEGLI